MSDNENHEQSPDIGNYNEQRTDSSTSYPSLQGIPAQNVPIKQNTFLKHLEGGFRNEPPVSSNKYQWTAQNRNNNVLLYDSNGVPVNLRMPLKELINASQQNLTAQQLHRGNTDNVRYQSVLGNGQPQREVIHPNMASIASIQDLLQHEAVGYKKETVNSKVNGFTLHSGNMVRSNHQMMSPSTLSRDLREFTDSWAMELEVKGAMLCGFFGHMVKSTNLEIDGNADVLKELGNVFYIHQESPVYYIAYFNLNHMILKTIGDVPREEKVFMNQVVDFMKVVPGLVFDLTAFSQMKDLKPRNITNYFVQFKITTAPDRAICKLVKWYASIHPRIIGDFDLMGYLSEGAYTNYRLSFSSSPNLVQIAVNGVGRLANELYSPDDIVNTAASLNFPWCSILTGRISTSAVAVTRIWLEVNGLLPEGWYQGEKSMMSFSADKANVIRAIFNASKRIMTNKELLKRIKNMIDLQLFTEALFLLRLGNSQSSVEVVSGMIKRDMAERGPRVVYKSLIDEGAPIVLRHAVKSGLETISHVSDERRLAYAQRLSREESINESEID